MLHVNEAGSFALNVNSAASAAGNCSDRLVCGGVESSGLVDAVGVCGEGLVDGVAAVVRDEPVT